MEYEEKTQEQQGQENFHDTQKKKNKSLFNDFMKDKKKQAKKLIQKHPVVRTIKLVGMAIVASLGLLLFFASTDFVVNGEAQSTTNDAKSKAISTSYSVDASTTGTDENGNIINTIAVTINENKTGYEIIYNNDSEYIEDIRDKLEDEGIVNSASDFTDFELAVIGALLESGADLDFYTEEGLKCFASFVKAESCTQNLDLRPNSEKENGKNVGDYIENYEPEKMENLGENEVPGVVLVQRSNTTNDTPTTLEYKNLSDFRDSVDNNDPSAINYFTIDEEGNLLIAKWEHVYIKVTGEYPETLDESEKHVDTGNEGTYILKAEPIAYSQYISKFKMPFEFLVQLLVVTEDPEFCMELVDCALDSKIVINIQEEETVTVTDETKEYTMHNKENKSINYKVNAAQQEIVKEDNYLFKYAKDDEEQNKEQENQQNNCTSYSSTPYEVNIYKEHTSHSYVFGVSEADTWIAYYKENYEHPTSITHPQTTNVVESKGQYEQIEVEVSQPITDQNTINNDENVKTFIEETKDNYEKVIKVAENIEIEEQYINNPKLGKIISGYKLKVKYNDGTITTYGGDDNVYNNIGSGWGTNIAPEEITVITDKVNATNKTKEIPNINYKFLLKQDSNHEYYYELQTDIDPLVECTVSSLTTEKFRKLDLKNTVYTTITEHPADANPIIEEGYYAIDDNGNFEKFLLAYDKSPQAQNQLNSIDSWLYGMMEEYDATEGYVDIVKYLLYMYDGVDRGVTELETDLFDNDEFVTFSNGTGWWWPIGSGNTETYTEKYDIGNPVTIHISSGVGPRWGSNHGGIDIDGAKRGTNIIAAKSGEVISVVDGYGDGYLGFGGKTTASYGNYIKIKNDDGTSSIYAHLEKGTIKVSKGETVEQGHVLGGMGTSGSSTGIHLHFEIRDASNNRLDPEEYVDPKNPRSTTSTSTVRDWLWNLEGGSQYINGNVWTVFDPEGEGDNTMNLAHGMVVADYDGADSWYPEIIPGKITVGQTVTEEQASKVWEKKMKGFNDAIDSACAKYGVTLTANKKDALVSYIYRTGYGVGQNNSIVSAYKNGGNAGLWNYMKEGYDRRPEYEVGTKSRIAEEYELFVKGDYNYDSNGTTKYDQYCNDPNI